MPLTIVTVVVPVEGFFLSKFNGLKNEGNGAIGVSSMEHMVNGMIDLLVDKSFNYDGIADNKTAFTVFINMYKDEIDFVVVGPENPLANGIIDYLNTFKIKYYK